MKSRVLISWGFFFVFFLRKKDKTYEILWFFALTQAEVLSEGFLVLFLGFFVQFKGHYVTLV